MLRSVLWTHDARGFILSTVGCVNVSPQSSALHDIDNASLRSVARAMLAKRLQRADIHNSPFQVIGKD